MSRRFVLLTISLFAVLQTQAMPAYVLQLPSSVQSVLIAETETSTLHRFVASTTGLENVEQRYMSIGERGVGKQRAWDRRTPLGIYFIGEQLDTTRLHEKYGRSAFPLDYPNAWDRHRQRSGDGIWIHGVTPGGGKRPPLDTDGCIALPNEALRELEPHLEIWKTPVIITRRLAIESDEELKAIREELNQALLAWSTSFRRGDWHRYFSLYDKGFAYRGMSRADWLQYRLRSAAGRPVDDFEISDVLLLADPDEEGLFLSRFLQTIVEGGQRIVVRKRLYWRRNGDGALRIVAEDNG